VSVGFPINPCLLAVESPPIPEAQSWKTAYGGQRGPMIDLSQAVPGTPPPAEMLERLAAAAGSGEAARYGPILGDAVLRETYAAELSRVYQAPLSPGQVAITAGCNQAFVVTLMTLAGAGDSVILPAPWYFNHKMTCDMLGIRALPLICGPSTGFVPEVAAAERLIDASTRAIILVTPNNPTGAIYPPETIHAFAGLARRRGIALVLDETYRDFLPPGAGPPHGLFALPDWGESTIQLYSFSKAHAIPGHRLGAILAAPRVITEIAKVLDSVQICPARPAQAVVAWAIEALRPWREAQRRDIQQRAEACRTVFAGLEGWRLHSVGAYFAYVAHPGAGMRPARDIAHHLATMRGVLALPGPYFGPEQEDYLRLAVANVDAPTIAGLASRLAD
jgi:aspartate/methionine/tyrosine aminotransferase